MNCSFKGAVIACGNPLLAGFHSVCALGLLYTCKQCFSCLNGFSQRSRIIISCTIFSLAFKSGLSVIQSSNCLFYFFLGGIFLIYNSLCSVDCISECFNISRSCPLLRLGYICSIFAGNSGIQKSLRIGNSSLQSSLVHSFRRRCTEYTVLPISVILDGSRQFAFQTINIGERVALQIEVFQLAETAQVCENADQVVAEIESFQTGQTRNLAHILNVVAAGLQAGQSSGQAGKIAYLCIGHIQGLQAGQARQLGQICERGIIRQIQGLQACETGQSRQVLNIVAGQIQGLQACETGQSRQVLNIVAGQCQFFQACELGQKTQILYLAVSYSQLLQAGTVLQALQCAQAQAVNGQGFDSSGFALCELSIIVRISGFQHSVIELALPYIAIRIALGNFVFRCCKCYRGRRNTHHGSKQQSY